jgi:hypothetical protein
MARKSAGNDVWRSCDKAQGSAAGTDRGTHSARAREAKDTVRANSEKVIQVTERALDLADRKKSR